MENQMNQRTVKMKKQQQPQKKEKNASFAEQKFKIENHNVCVLVSMIV